MNKAIKFFIREGKRAGRKVFRFFDWKQEDDSQLYVEFGHNGHDHLHLGFRKKYRLENGRLGDRKVRCWGWTFSTEEAVQLGSLFIKLADERMRNSDEVPHYIVVSNKEKIGFGQNFVYEDLLTAEKRLKLRRDRSYMFCLMQRFVETCENDELVKLFAHNLTGWAAGQGGFDKQQAGKMIVQLGMNDMTGKGNFH